MLTRNQAMVLKFIDTFIRTEGYAPSYNEIASSLGIGTKSNAYRVVQQLKERGFVMNSPRRHRTVEVVHLPEHLRSDAA